MLDSHVLLQTEAGKERRSFNTTAAQRPSETSQNRSSFGRGRKWNAPRIYHHNSQPHLTLTLSVEPNHAIACLLPLFASSFASVCLFAVLGGSDTAAKHCLRFSPWPGGRSFRHRRRHRTHRAEAAKAAEASQTRAMALPASDRFPPPPRCRVDSDSRDSRDSRGLSGAPSSEL